MSKYDWLQFWRPARSGCVGGLIAGALLAAALVVAALVVPT